MDLLKKFWPLGLKAKKGDVASLIIWIVIGILFCAVVGWLFGWISALITSVIPFLGIITGLIGLALDLYGIVNIVVCVLSYLGKL
ncbi:MAG: hypothetical protein IJ404_03510 [Clostridia bacterium]|nr:hypothetical protein [Clostridia bacterium]